MIIIENFLESLFLLVTDAVRKTLLSDPQQNYI